ncbi:MAG: ligand-binding sensor domain-containing protein, partial [Blastocatellia bacterium]
MPEKVKGSSSGNRPMIQAHDGEWWIATGEGLFRFPAVKRIEDLATVQPKAAYFEKDGLANSNISRMFEDSRGDIWIGSYTPPVTLTRWERSTGRFYRYGVNDGIPPNNWPHVFAEDRAGNVWIGLHYGELMRVRNGKIEVFRESDGAPHSLMQGLFCDSAGRLWIATGGGGGGRVDDPAADKPRFTVYRMEQGLSSNNLRCFTEDRQGRIYIGTARGVDRLDLATTRIKHFTASDGLSIGEVVAAFTDKGGSLWFGTREGLSRLLPENPNQQESQLAPPQVFIGNLSAGGRPQPIPELGQNEVHGLELEPNQSQLQIEFFGLSFAAGAELRYQYRFEGVDRDWSAPGAQRTVTASLSPGSYRFLVRAVNASGQFSESPAVISFRILPPFYRRWWFIVLAAAAV